MSLRPGDPVIPSNQHFRSDSLGMRGAVLAASFMLVMSAAAAAETPEWLLEGSLGIGMPTLANPAGLRSALWERGVKFQLNYIGEVQGNASGGLARGVRAGGRLELVIDADLEKGAGWTGGALHVNAYQIHGTGLSRYNIGNLMPVSNIEALPSTRLYEAWFEQKLLDGKIGVKVGQIGADTEFVTSNYAGLFMNGTFGWPTLNASDLPSGGSAYPLATPGVRLGLYPTDNVTVLLGLFNGDPAGPGLGDPQNRNRAGLNFRVTDPAFMIGEAQYKYGDPKDPAGLSGVVKVGAWGHLGRFGDGRVGTDGLSLANQLSNGVAVSHRGNQGIYGVVDQQIYRLADDPTKGIGVFARVSGAPGDRNLVDFYADAGINFTGLVPGRPDDAFGAAVAYTRIGRSFVGYDRDLAALSGAPSRSSEAMLEVTYSAQIVPGWTVQPNFQYIVRPSGGVVDPQDPFGTRVLKNAAVLGLRTTLKY
ncbi:MAG: Carbohydrate-selective porin OprB [Hyphomicrobiales bacterium]|nr:Carbohydrate-selective porin OprB [Hyphomicrobiales bacterium]